MLVTGRPPTGQDTVTKTCLQNMLVLSAGQTIQADAKGQAIQAPTVTLLASPQQAEILTLANQEGHIQLVLRNGSDQSIEKTPGQNVAELYGVKSAPTTLAAPRVSRPPARQVVVAAPPVPPPNQIVVIRGNKRTVEIVNR